MRTSRRDRPDPRNMIRLAGDLGLVALSLVVAMIGIVTLKVGVSDQSVGRHIGAAVLLANTVGLPLWTWWRVRRLDELEARVEVRGLFLGSSFALTYAVLRFVYGAWAEEPVDGDLLPFLPSMVLLYAAGWKFTERARLNGGTASRDL